MSITTKYQDHLKICNQRLLVAKIPGVISKYERYISTLTSATKLQSTLRGLAYLRSVTPIGETRDRLTDLIVKASQKWIDLFPTPEDYVSAVLDSVESRASPHEHQAANQIVLYSLSSQKVLMRLLSDIRRYDLWNARSPTLQPIQLSAPKALYGNYKKNQTDIDLDLKLHTNSLRVVTLYGCPVAALEAIPKTLVSLTLVACGYIGALPASLKGVKHVQINNCPAFEGFAGELPSAIHLSITSCPRLRVLPNELPMVVSFELMNALLITELPSTPAAEQLILTHVGIKCLTGCMRALKFLSIVRCSNLKAITAEINYLKFLFCSFNPDLSRIPLNLHSLVRLECSTTSLEQLPSPLPFVLELLCSNTPITCLPEGMVSLRKLTISWCEALTKLPEDLNSIREIIMRGCPGISSISDYGTYELIRVTIDDPFQLDEPHNHLMFL